MLLLHRRPSPEQCVRCAASHYCFSILEADNGALTCPAPACAGDIVHQDDS